MVKQPSGKGRHSKRGGENVPKNGYSAVIIRSNRGIPGRATSPQSKPDKTNSDPIDSQPKILLTRTAGVNILEGGS